MVRFKELSALVAKNRVPPDLLFWGGGDAFINALAGYQVIQLKIEELEGRWNRKWIKAGLISVSALSFSGALYILASKPSEWKWEIFITLVASLLFGLFARRLFLAFGLVADLRTLQRKIVTESLDHDAGIILELVAVLQVGHEEEMGSWNQGRLCWQAFVVMQRENELLSELKNPSDGSIGTQFYNQEKKRDRLQGLFARRGLYPVARS